MTAALVLVIVVQTFVLAVVLAKANSLRQDAYYDERADHAKCIAHIASVTSERFIANHLYDLAAKYDSVDEKFVIREIIQESYSAESPSIPALWMTYYADLLMGYVPLNNEPEYNYAGERIS